MIRNFNYTDRIKIDRQYVEIVMHLDNDAVPVFDASLRLNALALLPDAKVYVEAFFKSSYMRFAYGTVSDIHPPIERRLTEIDSEIASFRVKVVDESSGGKRLIALADDLVPEELEIAEGGRRSILPVRFADIGDELWQLNFEGWPTLLVNRNVEGVRELVKTSKEFFGLVFPNVVRDILHFIAGEDDILEPSRDWSVLWMAYMKSYAPLPETIDPDDAEAVERWIETAVAAFCARHRVRDEFRKARLAEVTA